jgi:hypothetical protein
MIISTALMLNVIGVMYSIKDKRLDLLQAAGTIIAIASGMTGIVVFISDTFNPYGLCLLSFGCSVVAMFYFLTNALIDQRKGLRTRAMTFLGYMFMNIFVASFALTQAKFM